MTAGSRQRNVLRLADLGLRLLSAAGLAIDAYVHAHLAGNYDGIRANVSQGDLFLIEAAAASFAALVVLVVPWRRVAFAVAASVGGGGLAAVLVYRYVNVGRLGPLPNMYEPIWYFQKTLSAYAEGVAECDGPAGPCRRVVPGPVLTESLTAYYGGAEAAALIGQGLPMGRMAEPGDIAGACLYLASDDARQVSGAELLVHGGGEAPRFNRESGGSPGIGPGKGPTPHKLTP